MSSLPAKPSDVGAIIENVMIGGDLSNLTPQQRTIHYRDVCRSLGLNPYTQPFAYLTLNGKLLLYAKKDASDQLRKIHNVSIKIVSRELDLDGIYTVRARATMPDGRKDEDEGAVPLPETVKGEFRSNLKMKATTKAKRRVTLSICGLAFLDEEEVKSIPGAHTDPAPSREELEGVELAAELDDDDKIETGVRPTSPAAPAADPSPQAHAAGALSLEDMAREAASRGRGPLQKFFNSRTSAEKTKLRKIEAELVKLYPSDSGD